MYSDSEYVRARNDLISEAERRTNSELDELACVNKEEFKSKWNKLFFSNMDQLCKERIHTKVHKEEQE